MPRSAPRPWHFWPVAVLALLWYVVALADYVFTQYQLPPYPELFGPEMVAYFTSLPAHADGAWGLAVGAGLMGALALLLDWRLSAVALAVAALAMGYLTLWLTVLASPPMRSVTGALGDGIMVGATVVGIAIWLYARWLHAKGEIA
ncbi:MAG: hypothetical protein AAF771_11505 [Pseudomonadota bacterium]